MHVVANLHLYLVAFSGHAHVCCSQFAKQVQRRSSFLPIRQLQGVFFAAMFECFFHVVCNAIESIRWRRTIYALVGPLVIVIGHPVVDALPRIRKGCKHRVIQKLIFD